MPVHLPGYGWAVCNLSLQCSGRNLCGPRGWFGGIGAVNIGVPFITFAVAIAAMFPMGGGTVVAIRMGREDKEGANHAFMTAFLLTLLASLLLTLIGMAFSRPSSLIPHPQPWNAV